MDNCIHYMFTACIPTSIALNICYLFTELEPMAPDVTMTTWYNDVQLELERQSSSPPYKVQHGNVAAVLLSLSLYYHPLPCTCLCEQIYGISVGVHIIIYIYVCM